MSTTQTTKTVLVVGASRGLGLELAAEYARRGWTVIGTVRGSARTELHDLAEASDGRVIVETVDIDAPEAVAALHARLADTTLDTLFVNAGVTNGDVPAIEASTEEFVAVMVTNALSPMRFVEMFLDRVTPTGTIAVMSSRQGSIALNVNAGYEVYRASKSALNQLMRSFAARRADDPRTLLLVSPGWVRTGLGGPDAPFSADETVPLVVDTVTAAAGAGGLQFLDYDGATLAW
jgi:NAD(P)-dependent dehydrogenase (short-subunit alcohol dehydrogenase family)